jgi:hypothetical protein
LTQSRKLTSIGRGLSADALASQYSSVKFTVSPGIAYGGSFLTARTRKLVTWLPGVKLAALQEIPIHAAETANAPNSRSLAMERRMPIKILPVPRCSG